MSEEILQKKLVELIEKEQFYEAIENKQNLDELIKNSKRKNLIPTFPLDLLLERRYLEAAMKVVEALVSYELVSGKIIKNISLDKKERLYPDCILYNKESEQIILIENKTSGQTEREAITELTGYSQEIFNHLPFLSNEELNYIVISTDFNTLLNHSVSSMILNNQNVLCLKPYLDKNEGLKFKIHFPQSWTDIGQGILPPSAFVSYTMCLYEKEEIKIDGDYIFTIIKDLILTEAIKAKTHGFVLIWEDGLSLAGNKYAISIYILNPYAFVPKALENGFVLNKKSELLKFISNYIEEEGVEKIPSSIFKIAEKAKTYLSKHFRPTWEKPSTWRSDLLNDELYKIQRLPLGFEAWGVVGDTVRDFYLNEAVQKSYFTPKEILSNPHGYLHPFTGLQIINNLCGIGLFSNGHYWVSDIFNFGKQVCFYLYCCKNCIELDEDKEVSNNAFLFWSNLLLINSIREIQFRLLDIEKEIPKPPKFPFYFSKFSVPKNYERKILEFINWFLDNFLENHPVHQVVFKFGISFGYRYNEFYRDSLSEDDNQLIKTNISAFSKKLLLETSIFNLHCCAKN